MASYLGSYLSPQPRLPYQHLDENMTLKWSPCSRLLDVKAEARGERKLPLCKWLLTKTSVPYKIMKSPLGLHF